jgi:hypothetical protein
MFVQVNQHSRETSAKVVPAQTIGTSPACIADSKPGAGEIQSSKNVGRMHPSPFLVSKSGYTCPPAEVSSISDDQSDDQKRDREDVVGGGDDLEERRAKNRLSAHQSRLRKRSQLKYLQNQVVELADENGKLSASNQDLISQLASTRAENASLRMVQQETMRIATALRLAQTGLLEGANVGAPRSFSPF